MTAIRNKDARHPGEGRGRQVTARNHRPKRNMAAPAYAGVTEGIARNRRPTPNLAAPAYAGVTAFHLPHPAPAKTAATGAQNV